MRNILLWCGVVILACGLGTQAHAADNLILNGSFEDGEVGWAVAARGAAVMSLTIDEDEAIAGQRSARLEVQNTGGGGMHDFPKDKLSIMWSDLKKR